MVLALTAIIGCDHAPKSAVEACEKLRGEIQGAEACSPLSTDGAFATSTSGAVSKLPDGARLALYRFDDLGRAQSAQAGIIATLELSAFGTMLFGKHFVVFVGKAATLEEVKIVRDEVESW